MGLKVRNARAGGGVEGWGWGRELSGRRYCFLSRRVSSALPGGHWLLLGESNTVSVPLSYHLPTLISAKVTLVDLLSVTYMCLSTSSAPRIERGR